MGLNSEGWWNPQNNRTASKYPNIYWACEQDSSDFQTWRNLRQIWRVCYVWEVPPWPHEPPIQLDFSILLYISRFFPCPSHLQHFVGHHAKARAHNSKCGSWYKGLWTTHRLLGYIFTQEIPRKLLIKAAFLTPLNQLEWGERQNTEVWRKGLEGRQCQGRWGENMANLRA